MISFAYFHKSKPRSVFLIDCVWEITYYCETVFSHQIEIQRRPWYLSHCFSLKLLRFLEKNLNVDLDGEV